MGTSVAVVQGQVGTTGLFQLTPRASLPFHTPLIAVQPVEIGKNIEHCFSEGLGSRQREVCSLQYEHVGNAQPCVSIPVAPLCCAKTDRRVKKMATCQCGCFKKLKGLTFLLQSLQENTVLP